MSTTDFSVKVVNDGGGNAGVPNGEWICRQDKFCSYAPSSLSSWALSQFGDYNAFADWLSADTNWSKETMVVLDDGSAKYGEPVCPASNCEAVMFYDDYMQATLASCPIGTEMELRLTGAVGAWNRCVTPNSDVVLSGSLPQGCNLASGKYCCAAGSVSTLHFVHQTAPCQPGLENGVPCIFLSWECRRHVTMTCQCRVNVAKSWLTLLTQGRHSFASDWLSHTSSDANHVISADMDIAKPATDIDYDGCGDSDDEVNKGTE